MGLNDNELVLIIFGAAVFVISIVAFIFRWKFGEEIAIHQEFYDGQDIDEDEQMMREEKAARDLEEDELRRQAAARAGDSGDFSGSLNSPGFNASFASNRSGGDHRTGSPALAAPANPMLQHGVVSVHRVSPREQEEGAADNTNGTRAPTPQLTTSTQQQPPTGRPAATDLDDFL